MVERRVRGKGVIVAVDPTCGKPISWNEFIELKPLSSSTELATDFTRCTTATEDVVDDGRMQNADGCDEAGVSSSVS